MNAKREPRGGVPFVVSMSFNIVNIFKTPELLAPIEKANSLSNSQKLKHFFRCRRSRLGILAGNQLAVYRHMVGPLGSGLEQRTVLLSDEFLREKA